MTEETSERKDFVAACVYPKDNGELIGKYATAEGAKNAATRYVEKYPNRRAVAGRRDGESNGVAHWSIILRAGHGLDAGAAFGS